MSESGGGIEGLRGDSAFARWVAAHLSEPFKLIDVGAAGGVARGWRVFGNRLAALAYEADPEEVDRLSAAETNPAVRYVAAKVGLPPDHPLARRLAGRHRHHGWVGGRQSYERVWALHAAHAANAAPTPLGQHFRELADGPSPLPPVDGYDLDYAATFAPPAAPSSEAQGVTFLPDHLRENRFEDADFLKIDVDGADFEILRSVTALLAQPGLLGVALEVSYFGSHDANDNTFHNMDRLMREKGFNLFDLSVRRYASAALPSPFMDRHPGPTFKGRPFQGDAIYLRDLASPFWRTTAAEVSDDRLLKLAALFSLFDLPDQAAELLIVHRDRLARWIDVDMGLEHLTAQAQEPWPGDMDYRAWIDAFEAGSPYFYDVYGRHQTWLGDLLKTKAEAEARETELQARLAEAEAALARSEAAPPPMPTDLKHLIDSETALRAIQRSTMWRVLAPLRRILTRLRRA